MYLGICEILTNEKKKLALGERKVIRVPIYCNFFKALLLFGNSRAKLLL